MKRACRALLLICLMMCLLLCSCRYEQRVIGTWAGDGTMDVLGLEAPIEFVYRWTFCEDGIALAEKVSPEGAHYTTEFHYSMTDDTIGWSLDGISYAVVYRLRGNTLILETGSGDAVFEKE